MPELLKEDLTPLTAQVQRMLAVQERILQALAHKRQAIRAANGAELLAATESEGALVSEMVTLEQQRRHLVQELSKRRGLAQLHPAATLAQIAALAKSGEAEELLAVGAELRRLVEQAAQENNVLREAGGPAARASAAPVFPDARGARPGQDLQPGRADAGDTATQQHRGSPVVGVDQAPDAEDATWD